MVVDIPNGKGILKTAGNREIVVTVKLNGNAGKAWDDYLMGRIQELYREYYNRAGRNEQ